MGKSRLEAFSDGVIAIIITIMVLELKVPHGTDWAALRSLATVFLTYVLSFVFLGIYWNNHHHLLQAAKHVDGRVLWANMHLLFWLSLIPFATGWMGENGFAAEPVALYGVLMFLCGVAYFILVRALLARHEATSKLAIAIGKDRKGLVSLVLLAAGVVGALFAPWIAEVLYVAVVILWLVPDRRIEKALME